MPARVVSGGNDKFRLQQSVDQSSTKNMFKLDQPDHRTGILRSGAPESSSSIANSARKPLAEEAQRLWRALEITTPAPRIFDSLKELSEQLRVASKKLNATIILPDRNLPIRELVEAHFG